VYRWHVACSLRNLAEEIVKFLGLTFTPAFLDVLSQTYQDLAECGEMDPQLLATVSLREHAYDAARCLDWPSYAPAKFEPSDFVFASAIRRSQGTYLPLETGGDNGTPLRGRRPGQIGGGGSGGGSGSGSGDGHEDGPPFGSAAHGEADSVGWKLFMSCLTIMEEIETSAWITPQKLAPNRTRDIEGRRQHVAAHATIVDLDWTPFFLEFAAPSRPVLLFHGTRRHSLSDFEQGIFPRGVANTLSPGAAFCTANSASHALIHASHVKLSKGDWDTCCLFEFHLDVEVLLGRALPPDLGTPFRVRTFRDMPEDDAALLAVSVLYLPFALLTSLR
jgi:hypothetical protein